MAVYTQISNDDIDFLLTQYRLGERQSCTPIAAGINNTNYLLSTDQNQYILTIVEEFSPGKEALPYIISLMKHLHKHDIPCPRVISDRHGQSVQKLQGKPALILSFLKGAEPQPITTAHCAALGDMLAQMHQASQSFSQLRENPWSIPHLLAEKDAHLKSAAQFQPELPDLLEQHFANLEKHWPTHLPQGGIHADLFPDNTLFTEDKLTGLIDFYLSAQDILAYDLAICINAWCFDNHKTLNRDKVTTLLSAYQNRQKLTQDEIDQLQILHQGAAIRFLLSRLAEWTSKPEDALVMPHNPQDYIDRLLYHTNNDIREWIKT